MIRELDDKVDLYGMSTNGNNQWGWIKTSKSVLMRGIIEIIFLNICWSYIVRGTIYFGWSDSDPIAGGTIEMTLIPYYEVDFKSNWTP